jgi:farnesyl-diphosphate farnesyltransferase
MDADAKAAYRFCKQILPQVSRTFALNISILVGDLKRAVLVAYLFCRIADTVEDSPLLGNEKKRSLLDEFKDIFTSGDLRPERLQAWAADFQSLDSDHPYIILARNADQVMKVFLTLPPDSQAAISACVLEMSSGMRDTVVERAAVAGELRALRTVAELEQYCYYVAGTVGVMLTKLFAQHAPAMSSSAVELAKQLEVSFGLGLQLTNIIKDCREDYERGWCYLPLELAEKQAVPIEKLFEPANHKQAGALLRELIAKAAGHLDDALNYTLLIPRREVRMRLFCLWPLFFAVRTLVQVDRELEQLLAGDRIKIGRGAVYRTIAETTACVYSNKLLRARYRNLRSSLKHLKALPPH